MIQTNVNLIAVLIAAALYMIVGMLWYSQAVFGNIWMTLIGKTSEELKNNSKGYIVSTFSAIIASFVLACIIKSVNANNFLLGIQVGVFVSLGFVATSALTNYTFAGKSLKLYLIDYGYHIVSIIIMSAFLGIWH